MTDTATRTAVIIEDDPDVRSLLDEVFQAAGFRTVLAGSGLEGVSAVAAHDPVITTLDINLPGIDGFEAARRIRQTSATFIIMLSALGEESDVVLGLTSGADEYLVKPFRPRELRARIEALLRRERTETPSARAAATRHVVTASAGSSAVPPARAAPARNPTAAIGLPPSAADSAAGAPWLAHSDIRLDPVTHIVLVAQQEVELTPTEFALLATLLESQRRVRSKSELTLVLRGDAFGTAYTVGEADKRSIETHMANLRRKIGDSTAEPRYIETVRGVGYRLTPRTNGTSSPD
ncbi:response regulator transcription factor [Microbacterium panaciterrae]|uniref:Response regulator transcription factor n=1 Tax=Microbacterium panaciterrae TaxID=985759 RepID=A0ABP8PGD4_9MICO